MLERISAFRFVGLLLLQSWLKRTDSEPRGGGSRTSQDLRRGSGAAEEERAADVRSEKDLVRRRSGEAEEESMPARRSRRQEAQKPVTGVNG